MFFDESYFFVSTTINEAEIFCIFEKKYHDTRQSDKIFRKILRIPSNKLNDLNDYISKLEETTKKSSKILPFAGSWVNIDDSAFEELTK